MGIAGENKKFTKYLPGEVVAAFLWAQIKEAEKITAERLNLWNTYNELLEPLESKELLRRPIILAECQHNAHMYYILLPSRFDRQKIIDTLKKIGVQTVFHYIPLHSSPAGKRLARTCGELNITTTQSESLLRLPLWVGLSNEQQQYIVESLYKTLTLESTL